MEADIKTPQEEFYEVYWQQRRTNKRLHTKNNISIPPRIIIAVELIFKDFNLKSDKRIKVLDIGCGEGMFGKLLKERLKGKVKVFGCDISESAVKEATPYYDGVSQVDIETGNIAQKFNKQKFDYIVILDVLEHLFRPKDVLRQCGSLLRKDGFLIASFPNIAWYRYRIDMLRGRFPKTHLLFPGEHIQNFTLASFYKLLRESSFYPIHTDGHFIFPIILRPMLIFYPLFKKLTGLFGYQLVVKSRREE